MNAPEFLDTNILVYAYSSIDPVKQQVARGLVLRALAGEFVVSSQVLAEFACAMLHKAKPQPSPANVLAALDSLAVAKIVTPDDAIIRRGVEAHVRYGIHFYDGMIIAAAERAGCARIWSEDLNPKQKYFGIEVANPFVAPVP